MAKKVATTVEKESQANHGWFRRKQKPDAKKKETLNESKNKPFNHVSTPAVHGSQPAYYEGSESMYVKLQESLKQTGNLNHPDTQKKEMDYKKSLGINDLRDYHDIKSGNYISKTLEQPVAKIEVATKLSDTKEIAKKDVDANPGLQSSIATTKPIDPKPKSTQQQQIVTEIVKNNPKIEAPPKVPSTSEIAKKPENTTVFTVNKPLETKDEVTSQSNKVISNFTAANAPSNAILKGNKDEKSNSKETNSPKTEVKENKEKPKNIKENSNSGEKELKIVIPDAIKPVVTPRLDKAVDSEQSEVAPDSATTLNILGLASVAQEFRDQGQEAKAQAKGQAEVVKTLKSKIKEVEKEIKTSDTDLQKAEKEVQSKESLVNHVEKGLSTSVIRQKKVEQEVGTYQQEYQKNKTKASDLNSEAKNLLGGSQKYEDPREPDSGNLTNKLKELSKNANTIDQAIDQAGHTTQKLSQEAKQAKDKNEKIKKDSTELKKTLLKSKAKLSADKQKNIKAKAQLQTLHPKLKQSESEGKKLNQEANAVLLDSYIIESDITKAQNAYYANMATVEGRNSLKKKEAEKIEQAPSELSQGETLLVAFVQLKSEEEQTAFLGKLDKSEQELLKSKYDEVIANYDTNEAYKQTSIGQNVESIRDAQIEGFNNKRKDALQKPLNLVTKNLNRITGLKRLWMSVSIALSGIWNSVTSVTWADVGKFIEAIFSPIGWVKAIGSSISGIWDDLSNWKGFSEDPVGMILQKAAGIANKVLTIAGVITGILGLLTIAAAVGSFFTLGALGGVAFWLGSATVTMGTITFWVGAVALGLNILNGIKNIYDIHTAKTADVLFKNTNELKSDIVNSGMSILAIVGGKASVKGGTSVRNLAKNHPRTFGKRMFISLKNGIKARLISIPKKIGSLFKKGTWLKAYQGFQKAYNKAKTWTKERFQKKKPVQNDPMRYGPYEEQLVPDRMHERPLVSDKKLTDIADENKQLQNENTSASKKENKALKELEEKELKKKQETSLEPEVLSKVAADRKQMCYDFYKKYGPGLTDADIANHLKGIDFNKPVKTIRIPPDGLGPEGNELYQFTRENTDGKTLSGQYYTDNPASKPSELGVAEKYQVPDANYEPTNIIKSRNHKKIIFDKTKPLVGLKSTAAPIDDIWSFKDKPVPTPGGAEQIYIPKNQ